jgi:hypothetical protein
VVITDIGQVGVTYGTRIGLLFLVTRHEKGGKTSTDKILTNKKIGIPNERK